MTNVSHPLIVPDVIEERAYQLNIARNCHDRNTLLILPTGLGKTIVALLVSAEVLQNNGKVLVMAPTKPLTEQHFESFSKFLRGPTVGEMSGNIDPEKRIAIFNSSDVIVSTPQVVANDLENGRYDLSKVKLVIYDEAHRSVGNYAYVHVASSYDGRTLGMTASPGFEPEKIEEVCYNLSIDHIEMRSEYDPDVSPYVHDIFMNRIEVVLPQEISDMVAVLNKMLNRYVRELTSLRLMDPNWPASTTHLLMIGNSLRARLNNGEKTNIIFRGMVAQAIAIKLLHAIGLAETQGATPLRSYLRKIDEESREDSGGKASREIVGSDDFKELWKMVTNTKIEHPKISRVMSLVSKEVNSGKDTKVLVFSHYRETCDLLVEKLSAVDGARVGKLVGQSKGGLRQKEQISLLEDFRNGTYNVIVSTSVGEEGLDVTSTDLVVFYEPVPSEIRTIQRRGRTGRKRDGEVYVLITKDTRDEAFDNSSRKKEDLMRSRLEKLNRELEGKRKKLPGSQKTIGNFE